VPQNRIDAARNAALGAIRGVLSQQKINGRITLSGYEGSELLVGRLLVECGADLRYVGSACPATPWNALDAEWLRAKGVQVQFRASLENDLDALHEYQPQLAIGTTPVVQAAKEARVPALYYTNLISARPLMGVAGAGSLIQVINGAMGNQARFNAMKDFFGGVGQGDGAGVWEGVPKAFPNFRKEMRRQNEKAAKKREAIGT
jgi:chlorophyllide a reductase subunit Y